MSASIRTARSDDVEAVWRLQFDCYPRLAQENQWSRDQLAAHQERFPQGQFVAESDGAVVGYCANMIVWGHRVLRPHRYRDVTGQGWLSTHEPQGDTLYGVEVMVHPGMRGQGIGTRFYEERFDLVRRLGLRRYASGGRVPGYREFQHQWSPQEYVRRVLEGELVDRTLSVQLKAGLRVEGVIEDYMHDPSSGDAATLLVWENPAWAMARPPSLPEVEG